MTRRVFLGALAALVPVAALVSKLKPPYYRLTRTSDGSVWCEGCGTWHARRPVRISDELLRDSRVHLADLLAAGFRA